MLNGLVEAIRNFFSRLRPWVIICPWQQAVRVRLGKHQKVLGPGIHFRLPWADLLFVQSVRLRITTLGRQTVTTRDGKAITFCGSVGYSITDIALLYSTLHHAEDTIMNLAKNAVAQFIYSHNAADCSPEQIHAAMSSTVDLSDFGISVEGVYLTDFACVKTYRFIGNDGDYSRGGSLTTSEPMAMNGGGPYAQEYS